MTLIGLLIFALIFVIVGSLAWWVIGKLPEPMRMTATIIVAVILLIVLLSVFLPSVGNQPIWPR